MSSRIKSPWLIESPAPTTMRLTRPETGAVTFDSSFIADKVARLRRIHRGGQRLS